MPAVEHKDYPNQVYAWYVVGVLTIAYIFSFIDRQILNLLVEPIREDLQLSDTQISLLQGIAFALFYTLMGIPIARLADVANRRAIIAAGVFLWSLMTAMCGLTKTFWQLFAARIGVGVGEAALSPPSYSLFTDYFPPGKVTRAIAVFTGGSIEAGKWGDVILLDSDPLESLEALVRPSFVMQNGKIVFERTPQ